MRVLTSAFTLISLLAVFTGSRDSVGRAGTLAPRILVSDASPSWSPDGTQIAFERTRLKTDPRSGECCLLLSSSLFLIKSDGSRLRRLPGSGRDADPAWSPKGTQLAFTRRNRLYVMEADGTGARALRGDSQLHQSPTWSPDGEAIAFWRGTTSGRGGVWLIAPDGTGVRRLVTSTDPYGGASWSPDGSVLAFGKGFNIFIIRRDGSDLHALTAGRHNAYYEPVWSPTGAQLAFRSDRGVFVMRADGTGLRRITRAPDEINQDTHPSWSPDGRLIAFAGLRGRSGEARIYVVAPNGKGLKRLTKRP